MENIFSKDRFIQGLNDSPSYEGINPSNLVEKLSAIAEIGRTQEGGYTRHPYTNEEKAVKELFKSWMIELEIEVYEDCVGNLFGRWQGSNPEAPVIMTGSHLDTVPNGGAFDGALGCVSSLLAIKALKEKGMQPKRTIELAVFADEEGSRFGHGLFGSQVLMGEVDVESLQGIKDDEGTSMYDAMKQQGHKPEQIKLAAREPKSIHAFWELHIEQGLQLELTKNSIGIVNGIAGPSLCTVTFFGSTDHAGNTPMHMRKDSLACAAEWITEIEKLPRTLNDTAVATVGKIQAFPNGTNVIAGKVQAVVDVRDIYLETRDELLEMIIKKAEEIAKKREIHVEIETGIKIQPVLIPDNLQAMIQTSAELNGLSTLTLLSGAGHDAMIIGKHTNSAMIFVPSAGGKSHSPLEWTSLPDCVNGVKVLMDCIWKSSNE